MNCQPDTREYELSFIYCFSMHYIFYELNLKRVN